MQLVDSLSNGIEFAVKPAEYIQPNSWAPMSSKFEAYATYRFIIPNEDIKKGYNGVKLMWSKAGFEGHRNFVEEKRDGFSNFNFDINKTGNRNIVIWEFVTKVVVSPPNNTNIVPAPSMKKSNHRETATKLLSEYTAHAEGSLPKIDNLVGINNYYFMAFQWYEQGNNALKAKDIFNRIFFFFHEIYHIHFRKITPSHWLC